MIFFNCFFKLRFLILLQLTTKKNGPKVIFPPALFFIEAPPDTLALKRRTKQVVLDPFLESISDREQALHPW